MPAAPHSLRRVARAGGASGGRVLPAWGADPQTYKVRLEGAVARDIDTTLSASSDLVTLRKSAPVSPVGSDPARARRYGATEDRAGELWVLRQRRHRDHRWRALTSADLADKLAAMPAGKDATVVVSFIPGPLYHLGKITIEGDLPRCHARHAGSAYRATGGRRGRSWPARALLAALQDNGYAFAKVDMGQAELLPDSHELDVHLHVQTGAWRASAPSASPGCSAPGCPRCCRGCKLHAGEQYSAQALDQARRNLLAMGVFGTVTVNIATAADAERCGPGDVSGDGKQTP